MDRAIRQLNQVRRFSRLLLFIQRAMQWSTVVVATALLCGIGDYALRLPWWFRLLIGVAAAGSAGFWLWQWVTGVIHFQPAMTSLALRAERLFPQMSGSLASAVEFSSDLKTYSPTSKTASLARASIARASARLGSAPLMNLIAPAKTVRWLASAAAMLLVTAGVCLAAPDGSFGVAWHRWLMPLGDARWPTRFHVESLVTEQVVPIDQPLKLEAQIVRGYRESMRTWLHYRFVRSDRRAGTWRVQLTRDRTDAQARVGRFERMLDVSKDVASWLPEQAGEPLPWVGIDVFFEAGDHQTEQQRIRLVRRPAVRELHVTIEPPQYARAVVAGRTVTLIDASQIADPLATASALRGASVRLRVQLNKPMAWPKSMFAATFPGLSDLDIDIHVADPEQSGSRSDPTTIELELRLDRTIKTPIHLTDSFGLSNMSERRYQIRAVEDSPPAASMLVPAADESVLATAVVDLKTMAQDDVGMAWLQLEAIVPHRLSEDQASSERSVKLAERAKFGHRLELEHGLQLQGFALKPGDEVRISALAQDIFGLDGERHEPQRSEVRRLKIIEPSALIAQLRSDLDGVRQTAVRIDAAQETASSTEGGGAEPAQHRISGRLQNQRAVVAEVRRRMERNRLEAMSLRELVDQVVALNDTAAQASAVAAGQLQNANMSVDDDSGERSAQEARREQRHVREALGELINLLDQRKDVQALQLKLKQIETTQRVLAADTRRTLARTVSLSPPELSPQQAQELGDMSASQDSLQQQAAALVEQMQTTAEVLSRGSRNTRDQASAVAVAEAASVALRKGLGRLMQQASKRIDENRLSQAGAHQQESLEVIRQMLDELHGQDRRRQQILRRRLAELAASIQRLIDQQASHIEWVEAATDVAALAPSLATLRVNTLAVDQQALAVEQPRAAGLLGRAAEHQAEALASLRSDSKPMATAAETKALKKLTESLVLVRKKQDDLDADRTAQQRDKLRGEYEQLAAKQSKLRERTVPLAGRKSLNRREKLESRQIGDGQADVRVAAAKLGEKMQTTTLFKHAHGRIDELTVRVAAQLRTSQVGDGLPDDQDWIVATLKRMAAALEQEPEEDEFSKGAGGGGGGGAGGSSKLASSLAELKLLRGLQDEIYRRTKALDTRAADNQDKERYAALAREQGELKQIGRRLIRDVRSDSQSLERRILESQRRDRDNPQ